MSVRQPSETRCSGCGNIEGPHDECVPWVNHYAKQPHEHDWQANGMTEKTVELEGGFVRAKRTLAVQSCGCGAVRELPVDERRWRPYA